MQPSEIQEALAAYQRLDPSGWVAVYRFVPIWGGLVLCAVGVLLLLFGSGRAFRLVAGPLGAAAGAFWLSAVPAKLGMTAAVGPTATWGPLVLAVCGIAFPPSAIFFVLGLPAGLAFGDMVGANDWLLGFLPALLIVGSAGAALHRQVGAVVSSAVGGWLVAIGLLAALHQVGGLVATMASHPWGIVAAAGLFAVAGSVFQLFLRRSPSDTEKVKHDRAVAKQRAKEKRELEARWKNYSETHKHQQRRPPPET